MNARNPITLGLFLLAEGASLFGNAAISIVLPWLVLARTGDPALTGLVAAVSAVPSFLATLVSGHLIDKVGRRRMSVLADVGSALSVAALILVDRTLGLDVFWFVVLGLLGALFDVPGMTARETLLPNVSRASGVALEKVAGLRQVMFSLAILAGPGVAGGLMAVLDPMVVVAITAGCSALAALCMAVLPLLPAAPVDPEEVDPHAGVLGGWRFVRGNPGLFAMLLVSLLATVPIAPLLAVILPAHFSGMARPELLGLSMSAYAVGSMGGSILYAVALSKWRWASWVVSMLLFAGSLAVVAPLRGFWLVAVGMALAGIAGGLMGPVAMVSMSEHVPDRVRGRVMALFSALSMVTAPIGLGLMALLLTGAGIGVGAWACCLAFLPVAAYALLAPGLRSFVDKPARGDNPVGGENPEEVRNADDRPAGAVRPGERQDG
ncbi:MFS transporter [Enemella dayhoffiae]|uniref:Multidrug efflux pump Tap n=1 Tax=Enemella dayhoffiae TaxID=2016507 RepID=A0A255HBY6_9ACTN|nr:MFS transporter [Enemella dayhoffiae]OYO24443.1 MFS transporter [Enemella dayhoffiae]